MNFSIIIPCYNAEKTIGECIQSALRQSVTSEIIVIDDCSTDATWGIIKWMERDYSNIRCAKTPSNGGPGRARNIGISMAQGDWILFLDADDTLTSDATIQLAQYIRTNQDEADIIGYDWRYSDGSGGRKDETIYYMDKESLIKEYLSLRTDGSVIYTAIKRELIEKHNIRFPECYHEDVEFMFRVYWYAKKMGYFRRILYIKNSTEGSFVNTISIKHIEGFLGSWLRIGEFCQKHVTYRKYYDVGCFAVLATRVREIYRMRGYFSIYKALADIWFNDFTNVICPRRSTKYIQMAMGFLSIMMADDKPDDVKLFEIEWFMDDIVGKSWSCYDLHHSVFLAPDEIRTCCKRFFVDGQMKGDVALPMSEITASNITKAKIKLYTDINGGKKTPCDYCPFLEFKEWEPVVVENLSLEYHTICNLNCSYCSSLFNGGKQSTYDVEKLIGELPMNLKTVLWGGGEPTLGKYFYPEKLVEKFPNAIHRILTNSVEFSERIKILLQKNQIHVTTSLDAGTRETFKTVRRKDLFLQVFLNIDQYVRANPRRVTIKYILTNDNDSENDFLAFATLVKAFKWQDCNFQISCDFNFQHYRVRSVQRLYERLLNAGCNVVFVDDLLRLRMGQTAPEKKDGAYAVVPVVIWGAGEQAKILIENTSFFKEAPIKFIVDDTKIGETFKGANVMASEALLRDSAPIVIAAVQGYPIIYDRMVKMGIEDRLVKELIL